MLKRTISAQLNQVKSLNYINTYQFSNNLLTNQNPPKDDPEDPLKGLLEETEGLPIENYFSGGKLPNNMMITSKTYKAPLKRYWMLPLAAFVPGSICLLTMLSGGYFVLRFVPNDRIQTFLTNFRSMIPRWASALTVVNPKEENEFKMEFFVKQSVLKFTKDDICDVEVVTKRTIFGGEMKVVKLTIKMKREKMCDLEKMSFFVGCENASEAELIAKVFKGK